MKNICSLVDRNLVERLNHVDSLTKMTFDAIGLPQRKHQMWAVRNLRTLTILTHDSILATRIRLQQDQVIHYFKHNSALIIDTVKVKMSTPELAKQQKKRIPFTISQQSARVIAAIASSIDDDELRNSLLRVAGKE